jgi:hypothetical protein
MSRLWVWGDSFVNFETKGEMNCWPGLLATKLGITEVRNYGVLGSSQEYTFAAQHALCKEIQPDDYQVIVMTHPARKWYVHDDPSIGKPAHLHVYAREGKVSWDLAKAGELWDKHIQRPLLDSTEVENRLGWLAYNTYFRKWRRPIVINAHKQDYFIAKEYEHIIFGTGDLTECVSFKEIPNIKDGDDYNRVIKMFDPRFNHMCLSNHEVFAQKLFDTFTNGVPLDVTEGFIQGILTEKTILDPEFIKKELSEKRSQERTDILRKNAKTALFGWKANL